MPSILRSALEVTVEWGIPTLLAGMGTWAAVKWRAIRNWRRAVRARRDQEDAMHATWPSIAKGSARVTEQFTAITDKIGALADQITSGHKEFEERLDIQDKSLATILANTWAEPQLSPIARFTCDNAGCNVDVNPAYAEEMRCGEAQLLGYGYKSFFRDPAFHAEFALCAREHRFFEGVTEACRADGTCFRARVTARPFPDNPGKGSPWRWYGVVKNLGEIEK